MDRTRLVLVAPITGPEPIDPARLESALAGGDVAAVIIDAGDGGPETIQTLAAPMVAAAQAAGAAALLRGDSRVAGRVRADGVHVDSGVEDLSAALERFRPNGVVGAGGATGRHQAMVLGELDPDYVFFGRLDRPDTDAAEPAAVELATWWAELFEVPAIALIGRDLGEAEELAASGVEFVAARDAVWKYPDGPAAAVAALNAAIDEGTIPA
ncbi:thiamine phosphate synthase [Amorphus sp. 3PC139-8]|uniref:thiamine phosphate synthase n=1 Tax=Amorphus sp. 3PC139-8 TaxID=2735676 RepID=UPI00345D085B